MSIVKSSSVKKRPSFLFCGARATFLEGKIPYYHRAVRANTLDHFWTQLIAEYWETFPWRLPLDVEPIPGTSHRASTVAEWEWQYQVSQRTESKIRAYYTHRRYRRGSHPLRRAAAMADVTAASNLAEASSTAKAAE
ncbi:hypothetical protein B0H15DRAFT_946852 [Mycena belliarum]|uniref:Uncharacterized protein n=1 Tax=Mycena belliarum TaxID=1033014 RepID=A0AAD6XX12_9AGAR|nr:hypothetical protein B0H15DRAFT_957978 [Mycena belliae]KAJ7075455.1 hypothetical protein B0H15DRAFT_956456 [Mycena belliae]KAJ7094435.1 hypothetical protein B0H15DRAFT_946852 [Mycena belliae]